MAMKVKPKEADEPHIRLMSGDLVTVLNSDQLTSVGNAVRSVMFGNKSKYKPTVSKGKKKKLVAKQRKKDMESCRQEKVKPVLPSHSIAPLNEYDDERHALWWDFNTDLSKGEYPKWKGLKVTSIDASNKDKLLALRKSYESRRSQESIRNLKALGVTPAKHVKMPNLFNKSDVPHPAQREQWAQLVERNKDYEKDLIARYRDTLPISRALPEIYGHLDTLSIETHTPINASDSSVDESFDMIMKLEQLIADDDANKQTPVVSVTAAQIRYDDKLMRAEAKVFDLDINFGSKFPSAANDTKFKPSDLITSETQIEKDQWMTPEERLQYFATPGRMIGSDEIAYCYALRDAEELSTIEYNQPIGIYDMDAWYRTEGFAYLNHLRYHDSRWLREKQESIRVQACQAYTVNVGMEVHPLWHTGEGVTNAHIRALSRSRIRGFDNGVMDNMDAGTWYHNIPHIIQLKKEKALAAEAYVVEAERIYNEELATKIVDDVIARQSEKEEVVSYGCDFVEEEEVLSVVQGTCDPHVETIKPWDTERWLSQKRAEVVTLSVVRNERAQDVGNLLNLIKPKLAGLTKEQEEGARLVVQALNEYFG